MRQAHWRLLAAIAVVLFAIAVGLSLRERYATIVVTPQIVASPRPASPLPPPRLFRVYVPLLVSAYRQSKKCVALSAGYDSAKMHEIGVNCTYVYGPGGAFYREAGHEVAGMAYPDAITVTGDAPYFLGFNEPDLGLGITPQMAAEMWPKIIAANPNKMVVSPAPSHVHPEWLAQFYAAHLARWGYPPKLDVLAAHCYGSANFCIGIVSQVIGYAERWGVPQVWVTEFAFSDAWQANYPAGATWESEARKFINWMDAQRLVTRYYWWALAYAAVRLAHRAIE